MLPCVAMATGNGHTVCLIYYAEERFAVFDSLPGLLAMGLDEQAMLSRLDVALGLHLFSGDEEQQGPLYRKGRKMLADGGEQPPRKKNKRVHFFLGNEDEHQCDVTIFWRTDG